MRTIGLTLLLASAGVALTWLGGQLGWWWATPVIGLAIGIVMRPAWLGIAVALVVGGLGWGLPLTFLAMSAPVGQLASVVERVIGLTATGGLVIVLATISLGCVLSLVGAWVGIAGKRLLIAYQ